MYHVLLFFTHTVRPKLLPMVYSHSHNHSKSFLFTHQHSYPMLNQNHPIAGSSFLVDGFGYGTDVAVFLTMSVIITDITILDRKLQFETRRF